MRIMKEKSVNDDEKERRFKGLLTNSGKSSALSLMGQKCKGNNGATK